MTREKMINEQMMNSVYDFVKKSDIVTRKEVSKSVGITLHNARKCLDELTIQGKLKRHDKKTEQRGYYLYTAKGLYKDDENGYVDNNGYWVKK